MGEFEAPYRIELGAMGRWIIVSKRDGSLAWSGSCWVEHERGFPTGRAQISNFGSEEEAREAARDVWGC
jgi:hypothetical protein